MIPGIDAPLQMEFAPAVQSALAADPFFWRYLVLYGGRGGIKSWTFAQHAIAEGAFSDFRFLMCREVQTSIKDSVHKLLVETIHRYKLDPLFTITDNSIRGVYGSEYIFKGLRHNLDEIKSTEGIDRCWVEEAEKVSEESWDTLTPTIRKPGSQIWVSFNPKDERSATYQKFVAHPPPDAMVKFLSWRDNPWFPEVLRKEMEHCRNVDQEKFQWVWEGYPQKYGQAVIFKNKIRIEDFDTPDDVERFLFGADWGYGPDPTCLLRCYVRDRILYIDHAVYGYGFEIDDLPTHFAQVPGSRSWRIRGDSHRPDTISYLARNGFDCVGAVKGPDSVKDGIEFLKNFDAIVLHSRLPHGVKDDFESYRWKEDRVTGEILPVPLDKNNHAPDALRYATEPIRDDGMSIFEALATRGR